MATVTGFTAERMLEIEESTVVDGEVQGDDLFLHTRGGTPINAGNVRGAIGATGPTGPPGPGPIIGEIRTVCHANTPVGWLLLNGQTVVNADTLYPALWAVVPASWKSGTSLVLPDATRRHLVGGVPGEVGGSDLINLQIANIPAHTHAAGSLIGPTHTHADGTLLGPNHTHPVGSVNASVAPNHDHSLPEMVVRTSVAGQYLSSTPFGAPVRLESTRVTGQDGTHDHSFSGNVAAAGNGSVTGATAAAGNTGVTGSTGSVGSGTDYEHRPQYLAVSMMIYSGTA